MVDNTDIKKSFTDSNGRIVDDNENCLTLGENGPLLMQDIYYFNKIANFDRERIPERVVHAKGSGAFGYFEVTHDITKYTKACIFSEIGKKTPMLARFSTVGGERGSADTARDPRGFALKFYTEEGNWDMVANNTPVFFVRDAMKFIDFIRTQKRDPVSNLKDPNRFWDFWANSPEACHQVTILYSDRGTPYGYRNMNGYSGHTFKLINKDNEIHYVKMHFKTDQGIKNLDSDTAIKLMGENPDFATEDLYEAIKAKNFPTWTLKMQIMPEKDAESYEWNILDMTKVWPHKDYPLIEVGKMVLDRNPTNFFCEIEQSAFNPANLIPGIEVTNDKMLQGRLISYSDTQRYRLGVNYEQLPVNCPYRTRVYNYKQDGFMRIDYKDKNHINYYPNSFDKLSFSKDTNDHNLTYAPNSHPDNFNSSSTTSDSENENKYTQITSETKEHLKSETSEKEVNEKKENKEDKKDKKENNEKTKEKIGPYNTKIKECKMGRFPYTHPNSDFLQPGMLYAKALDDKGRDSLIKNMVGSLIQVKKDIQIKNCQNFYRCHPEYGTRLAKGLGLRENIFEGIESDYTKRFGKDDSK